MRILHVATTLGPENGGAAVACMELCVALAARGHRVEIFTTLTDVPREWLITPDQPFQHRGITIYFFPVRRFGYYWFSRALLGALWRTVRAFDVIHIHSLYRFHLPASAWVCRWFGRPYVVKPHGSLDPFLFKHRRWRKLPHEILFDRPAYANAAAIHYAADEERRLAESTSFIQSVNGDGANAPQPVVVPEGVLIDPAIDERSVSQAQMRLLAQFP